MTATDLLAPRSQMSVWLAAGMAAGTAEVLWVMLYAALTPLEAVDVARSIAATFGAAGPGSVAEGIGIHFLLSLALAAVFIALVGRGWSPSRARVVVGTALVLLAMVWLVNFFVVLPAVNPAFTQLMPLPVTLVSKLLFGLLMAVTVLRASHLRTGTAR